MTTSLTRQSALEMMDGLRNKTFSAEELIQEHIARIEEVQPIVNAVTHERFEHALLEAREADALRTRNSENLPELLGMPISIKEMYAVGGLPLTGGVGKHRARISNQDAEVVRRVRAAGAIVLCKTNTSTLTMAHETDNVLFGRTSHPLDPSRTPGGSSGGEGALISSFGSPWGIGSDVGGSIRLPAHLCGLCGIHPTHNLIPTDGEYPYYPHNRHMNSAGPIARTVGDVKKLYEVLSEQRISTELQGLQGLEIHWLSEIKQAPVDSEMAANQQEIAGELGKFTTVHRADTAILDGVVKLWQDIILTDRGKQTIAEIQEGDSFSLGLEVVRAVLGKSAYHKWILSLLFAGRFLGPSKQAAEQLVAAVEGLRSRFDTLIGKNGVLLMPVFPWVAPKHGKIAGTVYSNRGNKILPYLVLANALGYPAMTVYAGTASSGLPFGIQIVGSAGQEKQIFTIAERIEQICGRNPHSLILS